MKRFAIVFSCIVATGFALQSAPPKANSRSSIRGKVIQDPGGQPIRKANVALNTWDGQPNHSATTDVEGQFTIDDLKPGQYNVVVEHPGFVQSGSGRRAISISVLAGQDKTDVVFHMQPAATITGKIIDVDGDPMSNVGVTAMGVGSPSRGGRFPDSGSGATNDLGEFRIPNLRAGRYTISANPSGVPAPHPEEKGSTKEQVIYATTYYPGTLDKEQAAAVDVHPGDETPINFAVRTSRVYRVTGTLVGVPGGGVSSLMMVSSKEDPGNLESQAQLGEGCRFEFKNVLPGSYTLRLIVVTGLSSGRPATQMMRISQPVEVSDADVLGLRLQPELGGTVRGKFRMDTSQKFDWTQLSVFLSPVDRRELELSFLGSIGFGGPPTPDISKDGTFELKNVPAGNYQLLVRSEAKNLRDYITKSVSLEGRDVSDSGFSVGPETFLDVVVSANGSIIEGTVVDDKGKPVAYATVVDVPTGERRTRWDLYQRNITDERGHFSLRGLNPGKYTVLALDDSQDDIHQPEVLKSYDGLGEPVQLDEGARSSIVLKLIPADAEAP
jgi:uncharacterized protein (DUF2141 family)